MANRNNQIVSVPQQQRGSVPVQAPVRIQYAQTSDDSGASAQALFSLSDTLQRISSRVEDRLDLQAQIDGRQQGYKSGANGIPERADDTTIRGRAYNLAAADSLQMQFELKSREKLAEFEEKAGLDPAKFKTLVEGYAQGVSGDLARFDEGLAQNIDGDMKLRAQNSLERIKDKQRAVARDQQLEGTIRLQMALTDDIAAQASRLFEVTPDKVETVLAQMVGSAGKLVNNANQVGPDGVPLYSAAQRVAAERNARTVVSQSVGMAWLRRQPDMLTAYQSWKSGGASIEVMDETGTKAQISLREMLGESGYREAEDAFFDALKSDLALQSQVNTANDRAFEKQSDEIFVDLNLAAQKGVLTLPMVDAARHSMEPDKYLAIRSIAVSGGASVDDGATVSRLTIDDANGKDIRAQLQAEYKGGKLTTDKFTELYNRNTERLNNGSDNPVSAGRDYVGGSLGKLATELGLVQSISIPQAEGEYNVRIEEFKVKNERVPSTTEALDIARDVVRRYSVMDTGASLMNMPLPRMMSPAQKFSGNLSASDIQETSKKTINYFLEQHGGNRQAMEADEAYQDEMLLLKDYSDLIQLRDRNGTGSGTAKQ